MDPKGQNLDTRGERVQSPPPAPAQTQLLKTTEKAKETEEQKPHIENNLRCHLQSTKLLILINVHHFISLKKGDIKAAIPAKVSPGWTL